MRREQIHTQRPTDVEVLRDGGVIATATAGFTVHLVYEGEVPDTTEWEGGFVDPSGSFDPGALVGRDDVAIRLPTSGLTGRIRVRDGGAFTGEGPAPVEIPTK